MLKNPPANARDLDLIPGLGRFRKILWKRGWLPTSVFLPGQFHGQRGLVGYSPWGYKESNTAEAA